MKICIVGLGLIGGSLAKAIKKNTHESCFGIDIDRGTIAGALAQEAIDGEMTIDDLAGCDVVIVGLHPEATIKFITENADKFKKGGIVLDTCGVKGEIVRAVEGVCIENGVTSSAVTLWQDVNFRALHTRWTIFLKKQAL